jgi:hypothetical protein
MTDDNIWIKKINSGLEKLEFKFIPQSRTRDTIPTSHSKYDYLLLSIRATKANVLQFLEQGKPPHLELCENLYQSTKFLWYGSGKEISRFDELFLDTTTMKNEENSEYDVYFVKIKIKNYKGDGFDSDISSLKRLDSFKKLPEIGEVVAISKRLPVGSSQNKGFYNR